ncbi:pre-toxin TG domain-containing protein [Archangium lipolyticum]|uniref:pre-toxin TG domain-containing protein n=1 Tax=Archangium lipolyticum TaxID=2970465 RepID=UPI002149B01E|nr:pre-toxin TG domain-containing protein [Archangium lipolyticum]
MAEAEARRRRKSEVEALETAVAAVHARAWEEAGAEARVGGRLVLRLRMDGRSLVLRECVVEPGVGPEGVPVREASFRLALRRALLQEVWGWSGDGVVVLQRSLEGWELADSSAPAASATRGIRPTARLPAVSAHGSSTPESVLSSRAHGPDISLPGLDETKRAEAERWKAVEAKLEEYLQWGLRLMETHVAHLRHIAPGHRLTDHPLREKSLSALVSATLAWAYAHTEDPDFLRRSPSEVALYLLASRSALATAIELGKRAPPHLDYTPPPEDTYTSEELLLELAVGFMPGVGEVMDLDAAFTGFSLTGHRLSEPERLLSAVGVLLPFVNGKLLKEGGDAALQRVALLTGKGLDEVRVLSRVASHLAPEDVREIERLLRNAAEGRALTQGDLEFLQRVALRLETPVREASESFRRGEKLPLLGVRTLSDGSRLLPGTPGHLAQCWVDYQFRHPGKYPRFSYGMDPEWERLYRSILANKPVGNAFENAILARQGYVKNTAMMMPPPGGMASGFIPDSVLGNPGELVWGKPYHFVEAKARNELAHTGNLKVMLDYVREYGGHVELWVRSTLHPDGATRLSAPLQKVLHELQDLGRVTLLSHP